MNEYSASAKNSENCSAAEVEEPQYESSSLKLNMVNNEWRTPQIFPYTDGAINE